MLKSFIILILSFLLLGCEPPEPKILILETEESDSEGTQVDENEKVSLLDTKEESLEDRIDKFRVEPPEDDFYIPIGSFRSVKPPSWFWTPPKSNVVTINYVVPSIDESEHAIFSITQFNVGEGGHFTDNVTRWKSLFRTNDGAPIKPTFEVITVNGHEAVIAEFRGEYMGAGAAWHLRNHSLLVAEVREPDENIYFKLLGPTSTVNAHRPSFLKVLDSLELLPASP